MHVPAGFLSLSLADQMSVLQSVWLEVLVLGVAYRSIGCEDEVVFAEDFVLDEEMSRVAGLTELNAAISQLARRFRALNVDREEFVMLKAISLTNSGIIYARGFCFCLPHVLVKPALKVTLNSRAHDKNQHPKPSDALFSCMYRFYTYRLFYRSQPSC